MIPVQLVCLQHAVMFWLPLKLAHTAIETANDVITVLGYATLPKEPSARYVHVVALDEGWHSLNWHCSTSMRQRFECQCIFGSSA